MTRHVCYDFILTQYINSM